MAHRRPPVDYGSHLPILIKALSLTDGPVLELGMGYNSSFTMHWMCATKPRDLWSYDDDPGWLKFGQQFVRPWHHINSVQSWETVPLDGSWDVALVDFDPPRARASIVKQLADRTKYIVLHDVNDPHHHFEVTQTWFKWHWAYTTYEPNTAVLSNLVDLSRFSV